MTDTEINIAIAEACGKKACRHSDKHWERRGTEGDSELYCTICKNYLHNMRIPSYTTDLNAMHEVEKMLKRSGGFDYQKKDGINLRCSSEWSFYCSQLDDYNADSKQRAEAFLLTIGKWKE